MKNIKTVFSIIALALFAVCIPTISLFAQDTLGGGSQGGSVDPFAMIFVSVATLAAVVLPITGWIVTHAIKGSAQVTSWVVALALASLGHFLQLGAFAEYNWYWTIGYGIIAALTANGMADTSLIQGIMKAIAAKGKF
jgi:hypothetical protein